MRNEYLVAEHAMPTQLLFQCNFASILAKETRKVLLITDQNVWALHKDKFTHYPNLVLPVGEDSKSWATVQHIIDYLLEHQWHRNDILIGVGGGVITDIVGFVASIYKRGIAFGFFPTTILAMVDAAIGGKNGINIGAFKNMIGTITQPEFIAYDYDFLDTLPQQEWQNGFAEVIKHALIKDEVMFEALKVHQLVDYQQDKSLLHQLIAENVNIKADVIVADPYEKGERKLLNFGHTLAHAIEKDNHLPHGYAVSIGMVFASKISRQLLGFKDVDSVVDILQCYCLPTILNFDKKQLLEYFKLDKKSEDDGVQYILLQDIGHAQIYKIEYQKLIEFIDYE